MQESMENSLFENKKDISSGFKTEMKAFTAIAPCKVLQCKSPTLLSNGGL